MGGGATSLLFLLMRAAGVIVGQISADGAPAGGGAPVATAEPSATQQREFAEAGAPDTQIEAGVLDPSSSMVESPRITASSWSAGPTPGAPSAGAGPAAEGGGVGAGGGR